MNNTQHTRCLFDINKKLKNLEKKNKRGMILMEDRMLTKKEVAEIMQCGERKALAIIKMINDKRGNFANEKGRVPESAFKKHYGLK